jgi:hypothetical protein
MWFPFLNWLVLMMADQPFREPKCEVVPLVSLQEQGHDSCVAGTAETIHQSE